MALLTREEPGHGDWPMEPTYYDEDTYAIADLTYIELVEGWMVTRVNVPRQYRGQGHGSRLLRRVTDDADEHGATLVLMPIPSGPLDRKALVAWYRRHGFEWGKPGTPHHHYLVRFPRSRDGRP